MSPGPSPEPGVAAAASEALARGMRRGRRAGLIVGALRDGRVAVAARGADPGALVELGSITKVVTALILADMAEEGVVGLDDPLSAHLPAAAAIPRRGEREITLADLACHASGLPSRPPGMLRAALLHSRRDPWAPVTTSFLEASLARVRPRAPGGRARYSNLGAALLGLALCRVAGTGYEALARERVLGPLGMDETWVHPPAPLDERMAGGHSRRGRPVPRWTVEGVAGAGALVGTAADLLRLGAAAARPPRSRLGRAIAASLAPRARMGRGVEVGLGWMLSRRRGGPPAAWHGGGTGGARTMLAVAPQAGAAAAALATSARSVAGLGMWLLERLAREPA
jgi:CubicO group peptidase (beta-lactamase class C family)